jgi:hypothetical protein
MPKSIVRRTVKVIREVDPLQDSSASESEDEMPKKLTAKKTTITVMGKKNNSDDDSDDSNGSEDNNASESEKIILKKSSATKVIRHMNIKKNEDDSDNNSDDDSANNSDDNAIENDGRQEQDYNHQVDTLIKYTSDGLSYDNYCKSNVSKRNLKRAECCQKYYTNDGYIHQTEYNLKVEGIQTCIHCYIGYDVQRYADCVDLTNSEEECLKYYISNFTKEHRTIDCNNKTMYGRCLLCEALNGIFPKIVATQTQTLSQTLSQDVATNDQKKKEEPVETIIYTTDERQIIMTDIVMINDPQTSSSTSKEKEFILTL